MEMKAVQVSVILLFALSGVQRQAAALPTSTLLVRVGEDATLQCPLLDVFNGTGPATLSWYRKAAGHGPTLLVSISPANGSTLRYGDGVSPDKVSAAANGSLLLRGSEESDSAVYYCGVSNGSEHGMDQKP